LENCSPEAIIVTSWSAFDPPRDQGFGVAFALGAAGESALFGFAFGLAFGFAEASRDGAGDSPLGGFIEENSFLFLQC